MQSNPTPMQSATSLLRFALAVGVAAVAVVLVSAERAESQAIITNGVVELGVDADGQLNIPGGAPSCSTGVTTVGLRYVPTGCEAAAQGCLCEGWGIAYDGAVSGWANNALGGAGGSLASVAFVSTPSTATVTSTVGDLEVVHDYFPAPAAPTGELYEVDITVTNNGTVGHAVTYRRVWDADVEPSVFNEFMTIATVGSPPPGLLFSCSNGFNTPDPLATFSTCAPGFTDGPPTAPSFFDVGPVDHGAMIDVCVGVLNPGDSVTLQMFYGAASDEATALSALGAVGATVYALGQTANDPVLGTPNTFILAFGKLKCQPPSVNHAGCVELGWSALPTLPLSLTPVTDKATYVDFTSATHPAPYDSWPCATAGHPTTAWTSWADSCAGVPAGTAVFGAWCGPVVGSSGTVICTVDKVSGTTSDMFTLGFDINLDGRVSEFDTPAMRSSTEFFGAGPSGPVTAKTPFGSQTLPVGARMIAFPLSTTTYGITEPANFRIGCISP